MIADYFNKPLQGSLFRKMQGIIIGRTSFPEEERVRYTQNMSLKSSLSSIYSRTKSVTKYSTGVVSTEGLKI